MSKKYLYAIFLLVLAILFVIFRSPQRDLDNSGKFFDSSILQKANGIKISGVRDGKIITLNLIKKNDQWLIVSRGGYPANLLRISNTLEDLKTSNILETKSDDFSLQEKVQVVDLSTLSASPLMRVQGPKGASFLHEYVGRIISFSLDGNDPKDPDSYKSTFWLGFISRGINGQYARRHFENNKADDNDKVLIIDKDVIFSLHESEYIRRDMSSISPQEQKSLNLIYLHGTNIRWKISRDSQSDTDFYFNNGRSRIKVSREGLENLGNGITSFDVVENDNAPKDKTLVSEVKIETFDNLVYRIKVFKISKWLKECSKENPCNYLWKWRAIVSKDADEETKAKADRLNKVWDRYYFYVEKLKQEAFFEGALLKISDSIMKQLHGNKK